MKTLYQTIELSAAQFAHIAETSRLEIDGHEIELIGQGETKYLYGYKSNAGNVIVTDEASLADEMRNDGMEEFFSDSYCGTHIFSAGGA